MKKLLLFGFLLIIAAAGFAQAPDISYPSPQVFVLGKPVANLAPTNSGGAVPATVYSQVTTLAGNNPAGLVDANGLAARFNAPYAIASDATGNIYVADYDNNVIRKVTPTGDVSTFISTGLSSPAGVAVGPDGNIYIADTGNQLIKMATPAGVVTVIAGSGALGNANGPALSASFRNPEDVAVDASGNVYIADFGNNQIRKLSGGVVSVLAGSGVSAFTNGGPSTASFKNPFGVAVDAAGNVYVADFNNSAIRKVTPTGTVTTLAGNGAAGYLNANGTSARFNKPGDVAVDAIGNVFVTDSYNSVIRKISPNRDVVTFAGAGGYFDRTDGIGGDAIFGFPIGITFDPSGNMYTADNGTNCIRKIITKGYFIDKDLPAGLVFDPTTGVISGTPTAVTAAANYTIFAYNDAGSSSKTISIAVRLPSTDATLSGLTASVGGINPAFVATGKRYVINVANGTSSTTVTPVLTNPQASLTVNGVSLASGAASNTIPLNEGNNDITIKVTAEDGLTISNYLVSVVRAKVAIAGPVISYNTTNNFPVNVTIPNLAPTNTGGAVPAISYGQVTTFASGISQPWGITTDVAGNVYVADRTKQIRKITPAGAVSLLIGTGAGLSTVTGLSSDAQGNVYVADAGNNQIRIISPTGTINTLTGFAGNYGYVNGADADAEFANPSGVAVDGLSNIYIADTDTKTIRKRTLDGQVRLLAGTGATGSVNGPGPSATFTVPIGIASDFEGNVFVADLLGQVIRKITPAGQVSTFAGNGTADEIDGVGTAAAFDSPAAVAVDPIGTIYVADAANSKIRRITPSGEVTILAGDGQYRLLNGNGMLSSFSYPLGVAADQNGHIFVADYGNNAVRKIETLGYGIYPHDFLPAGLVFDNKTGIISGKPTAVTPSRSYKITAYNLGGSSVSNITIRIINITNEARLSNVALNFGTLSPAFASATTTYSASVTKTSIIITPTAMDVAANIKINGVAVVSGAASAPVPLALGANAISIVVTATDGVTQKTYTLNVTRTPVPPNADLSGLAVSAGTLSPAFASGTANYTTAVSNATTSFTITPTSPNSLATIQVNGATVASGAASTAIPLTVGLNNITTIVTDENGNNKTYTIQVTRAASVNADLASLSLSNGTLTPVFNAATLTYTAAVANTVTGITITPTTADVTATIKVNGVTVASGAASATIPLNVGANVITIAVTAQDGTTVKTYNLTVTRAASTNADLSALALSQGTLSPAFGAGILVYGASVTNAVTSITVTPTTSDAGATIQVNGVAVNSGSASAAIPLNVGLNVITTVVTAGDGLTTKTYTTNITRVASNNADLAGLSLSAGTLSPAFASGTTVYTAAVSNTTTGITLTPTSADANSVIKVNNTVVATGTSSLLLPLIVGNNNITVQLTAEDGVTISTYTITVTRAASAVSTLSSLVTSAGPINPVFDPATLTYSVSVANSVASATITPTTTDVNATVKVNGVAVVSGSASTAIALNVGLNAVVTTVTAEDGITVTSYTTNITRAPSANANLASLTLSSAIINPAFASGTLSYNAAVSNATISTTITPTVSDATASITLNGVAVTSGSASAPISLNVGLNTITTVVTAQDGVTTKTYKVDITRAASSDADLTSLALSSGTLSPAFTAANTNYTVTVTSLNSITVTPVQSDINASVTVNGTAVASGAVSQPIPLTLGGNPINILVTAADGTTKNYLITVNRLPSGDALLTNLVPNTGALNPAFASGTGVYNLAVGNAVAAIKFTPTLSDANATLQVNGIAVVNGAASQDIPLIVGANAVTVTVTAENGTPKNYTVNVVRAGSADATLSNLTVNGTTVSPAFASGTTIYNASVANTVSSVTVTPNVNEPNATVTVNGSAVTSGSASAAIPLIVGANPVTVVVTAQDGSTTKTYTVTVNRPQSSNADLSNLNISSGTLSPNFASGVLGYNVHVGNAVTDITLTPTKSDAGAVIRVNSTIVSSGSASGTIPLAVGDNAITVQVTAADATVKTYTVTVNRAMPAASTDANLASLVVSTGTLTPAFAQATPAYTISVPNTTTSISVTPTSTESHATITVNGTTVASGTASGAINLNSGPNTITTIITAQDGITAKAYTITVTRAPSTNADLANITLSAGTLNQVFAAGTISYTADVSNAINTIRLTPTTAVTSATVKVNGVTVASGAASAAIPLNVGPNAITTIVTAESSATKTYTVTVTRAASPNADLANLTLSAGTLSQAFAAGTTTYTADVGNAVNTIRLTPTVDDVNATVKVNGVTVVSGTASAPLPLVVGPNVIKTVVTAPDGTPKTYTVTVTRAQSPNANLANLTLSTGTLNPVFAAGTVSYNATVSNAITTIKVTPTVADAMATVQVNGLAVASGAASTDIALVVGPNVIKAVVTAEDGTTKTYIVTVDRAKSPNADLADLSLSTGTLNPGFAPTTIGYTASVSNASAGITVTATVSEPNATLQINGAAVASGVASANIPLVVGPNTVIIRVTAQNSNVKTYTITVTRAPSPDATLSNIVLSDGILSPGFASATTGYTASVANEVTSVTLTPTVNEPNATVKVNNVTVASGAASGPIALIVGPNVITTTVTAQDGVSTQVYTTTITRAPSSNAFLTALGVSTGNYSPGFGTNIFGYSMLVTNNITSLRFTPVLADNTATITIDDVATASGVASTPVVLAVENNYIKVVVTAQDGVTVKTYIVIVNRAKSSENDLSDLTISAGTLTPTFQSGINGYKALVSNAITSLTVKPTVADATATVKVNNVAVASGTSSAPITLAVGINTITAIVTAQNSVTNTYTIEVTREASDNADLSNLTANTGAFSQAFASNTVSYTAANVNNAINTIKLTPTTSDATATITVNGITVTSGAASPDIPLNVGINVIPVIVKAQKGNTKTYTVTIYRDPSSNADLAGITVSGGSLSPAFAPGTTGYNTVIDNANTGITVTPNTSDATSTVTVNGVAVTPGTASGTIPLTVGANTIIIIVTAQNGETKTYTIVATREASSNANLTNLAPDAGTLSPAFASATEIYNLSVVNTVTSIKFTPTVSDATATVKINGTAVTSGTASASIPLALGPNNMVTVVVTAQNNVTTKQYRVNVTRQPSSNADLSNLVSNAGALDQAFSPGTSGYSVNVSNTTLTATVTPTVSDANATVKVAGQPLTSGTESAAIQLVLGNNPVAVEVTAQDGTTIKTYTVTIHRAFSNNADLGDLQLSPGTLSSPFASGTTAYDATVPFTTNRIKVTPTLSDGTATVTVNGTTVTSGSSSGFVDLVVGPNTITIKVTAADGVATKTYSVVVTREAQPPSADASLSSLYLTQGELNPAFNRTTYSYAATVQSSVTKTNVVAISSEPTAKITINGVPVASGASSGDILLADGANQIFVVVTAEDGTNVKRYTIVVTRASFSAVLPNVFTPNGDGYNDTWVLANINLYPNCTVKIFNRGGQQVFNSVGYGTAWDGTFNGKLLAPDTYYYIIDLKHGQGVRSGSVTIIR